MKRGKSIPTNPIGRCYTVSCAFHLSARERLRALLGGQVHVQTRIFIQAGARDIQTDIIKRVEPRAWRWPWRKAA